METQYHKSESRHLQETTIHISLPNNCRLIALPRACLSWCLASRSLLVLYPFFVCFGMYVVCPIYSGVSVYHSLLSTRYERGGISFPFFVWNFLSRRFVPLVQQLSFVFFPFVSAFVFVWFCFRDLVSLSPLSIFFFVSCCPERDKVAVIAVWPPFSLPKYSKEVTDRMTMFLDAFGTHVGFCIRVLLWSVCLAFSLFWLFGLFGSCFDLSSPKKIRSRGTSLLVAYRTWPRLEAYFLRY